MFDNVFVFPGESPREGGSPGKTTKLLIKCKGDGFYTARLCKCKSPCILFKTTNHASNF